MYRGGKVCIVQSTGRPGKCAQMGMLSSAWTGMSMCVGGNGGAHLSQVRPPSLVQRVSFHSESGVHFIPSAPLDSPLLEEQIPSCGRRVEGKVCEWKSVGMWLDASAQG